MPSWLAVPLFWLGAAVFFGVSLRALWRDIRLRRGGSRAEGQVTSVRVGTRVKGGANYTPVVRFTTGSGDIIVAEPRVYRTWQGRFRPGRRVLIYYDPTDPKDMRIKGYAYLVPGVLTIGSALLLAAPTAMIIDELFS
ncbi:DUF3592 domain-containing protein [Streptomyces sp. NPDC057718]|uniref:DUF3592 domain-containing protein n=1 Tax=Streptomyces sp. NPDC057718 TaxID=3346225 RepID=UPI0036B695EF